MDTITGDEFVEGAPAGWRVIDGTGAAYFDTPDFAAGAALVARIAEIADDADHHPDVDLRYRGVTVRTVTHSEGGLTEKDLALARAVSSAAAERDVASDPAKLAPRAED